MGNQASTNKQSKSESNKRVLVGCGLIVLILVVCWVISSIVGVLLFNQLQGETNSSRNEQLTRREVGQTELEVDGETVIEQKIEQAEAANPDQDSYTISISEDEALDILISQIEIQDDPGAIGLDIREGEAEFEVDVIAVATATGNAEDVQNPFFDELFVSVVLGEGQQPDQLEIIEISTGSAFIDSFLPSSLAEDIEREFNEGLREGSNGEFRLSAIEFAEDELLLTYTQTNSSSIR
ncbi:MAG: hypothetical protein ACOCXP_03385 [Candidatus Dojkabacteria bacterium]